MHLKGAKKTSSVNCKGGWEGSSYLFRSWIGSFEKEYYIDMSNSSQQSGRQKLTKEELPSTRFGVMHLKNVLQKEPKLKISICKQKSTASWRFIQLRFSSVSFYLFLVESSMFSQSPREGLKVRFRPHFIGN